MPRNGVAKPKTACIYTFANTELPVFSLGVVPIYTLFAYECFLFCSLTNTVFHHTFFFLHCWVKKDFSVKKDFTISIVRKIQNKATLKYKGNFISFFMSYTFMSYRHFQY